jgi:16S rRNA (uracil1498-N3)-methyltransferase
MHRAYCPDIPGNGEIIRLSPEESHHIVHVLRLAAGEAISLADGKGKVAQGRLTDTSARGCHVQIESQEFVPPPFKITVAFGIPKGPALEFIIRRCTEVGIARFQPLLTQHSLHVQNWNEARWQKIIVEVAKQCQSPWFPELRPPQKLKDWLTGREIGHTFFFCHEDRRAAEATIDPKKPVDLLVGAEGGWSREESEWIDSAGAVSLGLGRNRLRAETAALVATVQIKHEIDER